MTIGKPCSPQRRKELSDVLGQNNPRLLPAILVARLSQLVRTGDYLMDKTALLEELFRVVQKMLLFENMNGTARQLDAAVGNASHAAYMFVNRHHAEIEAMTRDTERYRWLRDSPEVEVYFATDKNITGWGDWGSHDNKDEAIDAAMSISAEVSDAT